MMHCNQGAYFEAGFAEGLGLPVIYTRRNDVFKFTRKDERPHFDTNHTTMMVPHPNNLDDSGKELTATIRNTLPADAKLDD